MAGEDTPLRGAEPPAPAAAPARQAANAALELGHNCALLLAFFDGLGTGVQQILFLFFLVDVGGYPIERAAGVAARGWLLYALCQLASAPGLGALADRVGRRPVLLWGALVDALVMSLSYVPNAEWWVASHALMGCFDATAAMCNAVVVDSVVRRADDDDDAAPRGLGDIRAALSRGLGGLFVVGGLGRLFGYGLGYIVMGRFGLAAAMACAGLVQVPALLFLAARLPETAATAGPASSGSVRFGSARFDVCHRIGGALAAQCDSSAPPGLLASSPHAGMLLISYLLLGVSLSGTFAFVLYWGEVGI